MRRVDSIARTITLLTVLSIMYALLNMNIILLAPIVTIIIPFRMMQEAHSTKKENRRILNNLLLFNIATFYGTMVLTKQSSTQLVEILVNIIMALVYFKILSVVEKKEEGLNDNPEIAYEKINQRITALEMVYEKAQKDVESAKSEKAKASKQARVDAIKIKIQQYNDELRQIEQQLEREKTNSQG